MDGLSVGVAADAPARLDIKSHLDTDAIGISLDRSAGVATGASTDLKGIYINQTSANDSTSNIGIDVSVRHNLGAGGTVAVKGKVDSVVYPDYGPGIGVYGIAHHNDTNGYGTAIGVKGEITTSGTGTGAKTYAGYFDNTATNGGENVGIYVKTTNAGTYGLYQDGGAKNYFSGNVGIGVQNPSEKLSVDGVIESKSGGIKFPDGTVQTTAATAGFGSGGPPSILIREEYPNNTAPSGSTANTWVTRNLNTLVFSAVPGVSLSNKKITLPPGDYYIEWVAPTVYFGDYGMGSQTRLYNVTAGTTIEYSMSCSTDDYAQAYCHGSHFFSLSATSELEIQHWTNKTRSEAFGIATNSGGKQIFTIVKIWNL